MTTPARAPGAASLDTRASGDSFILVEDDGT